MPYKNPEDQRAAFKRHYEANKAKYVKRAREWNDKQRARKRKFVIRVKSKLSCMDCKQSYHHSVMEFDHVRGEKLFNIGNQGRNYVTMKKLKDEIRKCELVCANCHRMRTWNRSQGI